MRELDQTASAAVNVTGGTRLFAIVGDPVEQVRSPEMFNALFRSIGHDAVLVPMQVDSAAFDEVLAGVKRIANLDGIVITVPHKLRAAHHVDELLPTAARVGAVNAMARLADGRWRGEMLDGKGFLAGLRAEGCRPEGRRAFMAGAGGVARAIADALAAAGLAALTIHDVEPARAAELLSMLHRHHPELRAECGEQPEQCDLAINATPLGMRAGDALPIDLARLPGDAWVAEVVMKPDVTPLVAAAHARGHHVILGRRVLEHQLEPMARFFGVPLRNEN